MKLSKQLIYWKKKRGIILTRRQVKFLNNQTATYLETLIDRRELLTDIPVKRLRKGFVFKVLDKLYAYKTSR